MKYESDPRNIKLLCVLSYVGPLFFMGKFSVEKDDPDVKFHSDQGLILFSLVIALFFIDFLLSLILSFFPAMNEILVLLFSVAIVVMWAIIAFMGIYYALKGKKTKLPIVSDVSEFIKNVRRNRYDR